MRNVAKDVQYHHDNGYIVAYTFWLAISNMTSYHIQVALFCFPQSRIAAACQVTDEDHNVLVGLRVYHWQGRWCLEPPGMW